MTGGFYPVSTQFLPSFYPVSISLIGHRLSSDEKILQNDLEHAGYGLPWNIPATVVYNESTTTTYNDCSGTAPCNSPRAILSGNNRFIS